MTKAPAPTEHQEQCVVVNWLRGRGVMVFAVPNGAKLGGTKKQRYGQIAKLKKEGLMPGVPDLVVVDMGMRAMSYGPIGAPVAVEIKAKGGRLSKEQESTHELMRERGWIVIVAYGFDDARRQLTEIGL